MPIAETTLTEQFCEQNDRLRSAKIAHFIDTDVYGGAEAIVVDLSHYLVQMGFSVEILHFGNPRLAEECKKRGLANEIVPRRDLYKSIKTLALFIPIFRRFLKSRKIDLLHSHLFGSVTAAGIATAFSGIAHVGTLHDSFTISESPKMLYAIQLVGLLKTKLVTVSKTMEDHFRSLASFNFSQLKTIHNGVGYFISKSFNISEREQFGFASDELIVACIARLVPLKRHYILVRAFAQLKDLNIRLVIVGEGPEKETLEALIKELALQDTVRLMGFRSDISNILHASDIFALSSSTEGLSCSILESMASGLPAIVSAVGGNIELIEDGESGLFARATPEDFARQIRKLALDPALRKRMGDNAKHKWRNNFASNVMVQGYRAIYEELLIPV